MSALRISRPFEKRKKEGMKRWSGRLIKIHGLNLDY